MNTTPELRALQIKALKGLISSEWQNIDFYRDEEIPEVEKELEALEALAAELEAGLS